MSLCFTPGVKVSSSTSAHVKKSLLWLQGKLRKQKCCNLSLLELKKITWWREVSLPDLRSLSSSLLDAIAAQGYISYIMRLNLWSNCRRSRCIVVSVFWSILNCPLWQCCTTAMLNQWRPLLMSDLCILILPALWSHIAFKEGGAGRLWQRTGFL